MKKTKVKTNVEQGVLNADIQTRIGLELRASYDDVINQGVPDKFADLIQQMDDAPKNDDGSV